MHPNRPSSQQAASDTGAAAAVSAWSNYKGEASGWAAITSAEAALLQPGAGPLDLACKIAHVLEQLEQGSSRPKARAISWPARVLQSALADAKAMGRAADQHEREVALRRHAARQFPHSDFALQLHRLGAELDRAKRERDAAYAALARANGILT